MDSAHNEFAGGQDYTDSITVATADGTSQVITVTMHGTNNAAVITGTSTAALTETPLNSFGISAAIALPRAVAMIKASFTAGIDSSRLHLRSRYPPRRAPRQPPPPRLPR